MTVGAMIPRQAAPWDVQRGRCSRRPGCWDLQEDGSALPAQGPGHRCCEVDHASVVAQHTCWLDVECALQQHTHGAKSSELLHAAPKSFMANLISGIAFHMRTVFMQAGQHCASVCASRWFAVSQTSVAVFDPGLRSCWIRPVSAEIWDWLWRLLTSFVSLTRSMSRSKPTGPSSTCTRMVSLVAP